ncbi:alpha-hydroxy acid oxidase [Oceanobacter mangrovi]|uniref:alpha-hydroxy acid oxidase n=1 Tax=Oceanobacter mangrovi TaxID=2862510 RepID=UPI001FE47FEB|nr:alpha-hydroxy acid oxidase [Oceanobacter mangrovi]
MSRVQSVAEMTHIARRRLPDFAWEYLWGGAEEELTLNANREAFQQIGLQSHTLVANHPVPLECELFGKTSALPMAIGPSGFNGMLWPQADLALAKSAASKSIPFVLSTVSNASIEQVRAAAPELNFWFQLYALKDKDIQEDLLQRARNAGVDTLVVTSDALVVGNREWDRRNFVNPRQLTLRNQLNVLMHPGWLRKIMLPSGLPTMGNLNPYVPENERSALGAMKFIASQLDPLLDWQKLAEIRQQWSGKLILKGVLHPDDALKAMDLGLDGIVVTNHGGRQLDGASSSLQALQRIAPVVDGRLQILLDSGIRRGADIVKARALGADAVLLARATLFGVAAGGQAGATRVLDLLQEETARCLNLMGCQNLKDLSPNWLL